jgi:dihydrofolate reductase
MRLLLASSADGFLARGPNDDMRWTGKVDKAVFRLLTLSSGNDVIFAGSRTFDQMPQLLGRNVNRLSSKKPDMVNTTLEEAAKFFPDAWLIGGPTVALEALKLGMVSRAFICISPVTLGSGIHAAELAQHLPGGGLEPKHTIRVGDVEVRVFTEDQKWPGR